MIWLIMSFLEIKVMIQGQIDKYCEPEESKPELCIKSQKASQ
jgi:hypothetical protein